MTRTLELSGRSLLYVFYAVSLAALGGLLAVVVWPPDGLAGIAFAGLLGVLLLAGAIGAWRRRTGREPDHLGTAEDLAYDPVAYPGQAAKERWVKAVRRLPGDDEDE